MEKTEEKKKQQKRLPKYKRVSRREAPPMAIQQRDLEILRTVWDFRYLQSHHIKALIPGSAKKIEERLKKLYHNRYLDRLFFPIRLHSGGSQKAIYVLDRIGADLLVEETGLPREAVKWSNSMKAVEERYLKHALMISNFRVVISKALECLDHIEILFWKQGKEIADSVNVVDNSGKDIRIPVVPDGFFGVRDHSRPEGEQKAFFFVECDRSTMTNARYLKKMKGYWHYFEQKRHMDRYGIKSFRVLTVTLSEAREENLVRTTKKADDDQTGSTRLWFTHEGLFGIEEPESVLEKIWRTPRDGKRNKGILE